MIKKFLSGKKWFFEDTIPGEPPSFTWGAEIKKQIYSGKSKFQNFFIFDTKEFDRILILDGLVQLSTRHEHVYHEMLVHPAFLYHPNPKKVLIIGGGDGGVLREVVRYKTVEEIFLVDIDEKVIEVSKKYLPSVSQGAFNDKRLKIFAEDALQFVKNYKNYFDIIIDDLTDPTGPSLALWKSAFYRDIRRALKEDGVASFQTAYLKERFARRTRKKLKKIFPSFKIHKAFVGCFPFDEHTFSVGSPKINFDKVSLRTIKARYKKLKIKTKYYSPEIHFASRVIPEFPY